MANRRRTPRVALALAALLVLTGCSAMDTDDVQSRLAAASDLSGALVEVQHPGLPTNEKIVIWMFAPRRRTCC